MIIKNFTFVRKVFVGFVFFMISLSSSYAQQVSCSLAPAATYTISGKRTTTLNLVCLNSLNVTAFGSINVFNSSGDAIDINTSSTGDINISGVLTAKVVDTNNNNAIAININSGATNENIYIKGTINADVAFYDANNAGSGTITNYGTINTAFAFAPNFDFINKRRLHLYTQNNTGNFLEFKSFTQSKDGIVSFDTHLLSDGTVDKVAIGAGQISLADKSTIFVNLISKNAARTKAFLSNGATVDNLFSTFPLNNVLKTIDVNLTKINVTSNAPILTFTPLLNSSKTILKLKATINRNFNIKYKPIVRVSTPTLLRENLNILDSIIQTRQNDTIGMNSGDKLFKSKHFWFKPFGSHIRQKDVTGIDGYSANTVGFGIGVDGEYKQNRRFGFSFFFSNSNLDVNNLSQTNKINSFELAAYGNQSILDYKSMLFYQIGVGLQKHKTKRYIDIANQTAVGNFNSKSFYAKTKIQRIYKLSDKIDIIPALKGSYGYFNIPSYVESGAGGYDLSISGSSFSQTIVGSQISLKYKMDNNTKFISNMAVNYDFNNNTQSVDSSFQSAPGIIFNTQGIKNSALTYGFSLGISKQIKQNFSFNLRYMLDVKGSDFVHHLISTRFLWKF